MKKTVQLKREGRGLMNKTVRASTLRAVTAGGALIVLFVTGFAATFLLTGNEPVDEAHGICEFWFSLRGHGVPISQLARGCVGLPHRTGSHRAARPDLF